MSRRVRTAFRLALLLICVLPPAAAPSTAGEAAELTLTPTVASWKPLVEFDRALLSVSGPEHFAARLVAGPDQSIVFSPLGDDGRALPDGIYDYTLTLSLQPAQESEAEPEAHRTSGSFEVRGGLLTAPVVGREVRADVGDAALEATNHFTGAMTVTGNVCVGDSECSSGYNPGEDLEVLDVSGFSVIRMMDDATEAGRTVWWEVETTSDRWRVRDRINSTSPLTVQAGAPSNSLFVDATGNLGVGTNVPAEALHIADGGDILLESAGSTWEIQKTSDLQFELVDDGTGTAFADVLVLEDGSTIGGPAVGVFKGNPEARLHVGSPNDDGTAKILVEELNGVVTGRTLFTLRNNGNPRFFLENSDTGVSWQMSAVSSASSASFTIDEVGDPAEFIVRRNGTIAVGNPADPLLDVKPNGNLVIKGTLTEGSSAGTKTAVEPVDTAAVLETLAQLPLATWSYRGEEQVRHIGPMAEAFYAAFGLGPGEGGLTTLDTAGVALAAIQALRLEVRARDARIDELERDVAELRRILAGWTDAAEAEPRP